PLRRHYQLMQRYQPFIWAVFRTNIFAGAMEAARNVDGIIFQEITFMGAAALAGKIARLPTIFSMRGMEESLTTREESHPFFWFLHDADSFFRRYADYREGLARHIVNRGIEIPSGTKVAQLLDLVHATW